MTINSEPFDPFAGGELSHTAPLTPEQEEIWLSIQFGGEPANLAYNESLAVRLRGELDRAALRRALDAICARHEALRCSLSGDGRELCVLKSASMTIEEHDLSSLAEPEKRSALEEAMRRSVRTPFDLVRGPLVRSTLVRLAYDHHVLILAAHHIVCDGWSGAVLVEELGKLYGAEKSGVPANLPEAPTFSSYATARRNEEASSRGTLAHAFWASKYRDLPAPLELPLDAPRPRERAFDADRVDIPLPPDLVRRLKAVGSQHGASFVALLLSAFEVFLYRITGQTEVVVALPAAGQSITGNDALVGHCVRTLPIRADIDPSRPFAEYLLHTRKSLLDALDHPEVTFGSLIKHLAVPRDPSRLPLVSVMFNVDPDVGVPEFSGLEVTIDTIPRAFDNFEWFVNATVSGDRVVLETTFSTTLFRKDHIERRFAGFVALLESIAEGPAKSIADLEVMPPGEKEWVLREVNKTEQRVPEHTLVSQFLTQAGSDPNRTAVVSGGQRLSYSELDRASSLVARRLAELGVGVGARVGVFLPRSVELLVGLLAVLRTGAAYVPLDPEYPEERLAFIREDAELSLLLTKAELSEKAPQGVSTLLVNAEERDSESSGVDRSALSEPAYIIYTSGSTGRPKGVVVEHRNVVNFLASMAEAPGLDRQAVMVAITTPSFDISVLELFLPLTQGAQVVVATEGQVTDGPALAMLLESSGATHFQATPAGYRVLLEAGWRGLPGLTALVGGEALSSELALELEGRVQSLWNCYGPTETTVWSTVERIRQGDVSIGRPMANTRVLVLDKALAAVPPGVTGELHIGGFGVTRGYWNRPELTQERFIPDPFNPGSRLYKTGDLVRLGYDGRLTWLGRSDFQVKVRGHRIELGEIQARLSEVSGVREAVVIVREDQPRDQRIVAYVRAKPGEEPKESDLRDYLKKVLPSYMVPQHLVILSTFPLTPNGKVDRKALPRPEASGNRHFRPPETEVQKQIAAEMFELLGVSRVGLDDDFFALGGHSLLALRLATRVKSQFGVDLPIRAVFGAPTLSGMSDFVEAALMVRQAGAAAETTGDQEEFVL